MSGNLSGTDFAALGRRYRITPIQHPERSAAFEGRYLSRLPLSPPLIVQLDCWDDAGSLCIPWNELPFLICHLALLTEDGQNAEMVIEPDGERVSMLYGSLVSTPVEVVDREGAQGIYFAFADISVRRTGKFRLKVMLNRITGGPSLDTCTTRPFEIVDQESYVAPPITELTKHFDSQGVVRFGLPKAEW